MALNDFGLTDTNAVNGYGLNTYGFIWGCGDFWFGPYYSNGTVVPTMWSLCAGPTVVTAWSLFTQSAPTVATSWSLWSTNPSCNEVED